MLINKHNLCFFDCKNAYGKTTTLKKWSVYCTDSFHMSQLSMSWKLLWWYLLQINYFLNQLCMSWEEDDGSGENGAKHRAKDLLPLNKEVRLWLKCRGWRARSCLSRWNWWKTQKCRQSRKSCPGWLSPSSPLVHNQLPSAPFLSFSLWRDGNSSIFKAKAIAFKSHVTALILWSPTFQPLSKKTHVTFVFYKRFSTCSLKLYP